MKHPLAPVLSLLLWTSASLLQGADSTSAAKSPAVPKYPAHGSVERLDPALDQLLAPGVQMERLAEGFNWSEGPVWLRGEKAVVFSDVPENKSFAGRNGMAQRVPGSQRLYRGPDQVQRAGLQRPDYGFQGAPGDLASTATGRSRRWSRQRDAGVFAPLVRHYDFLASTRPMTSSSRNGSLYFTDPPYGLPGLNGSALKELMFNGVYLRRSSGEVVLLTREITFPNGIALSPDEKTLYINVSDPARPVVIAYDVQGDGTIANGRVFFDAAPLASAGGKGLPDGLKVDARGNVWTTGPGGVLVLSPDGRHLGTLLTGEATGNCAWGDDGSTLYITADMYLLRVKTLVKGLGFSK
ncbi:MAG: SMP-30/gluconolactonase/LRE family protein [Verrucomicrobiae bacterium]|nr:SMP-30/gluconolactonase/LRE family protein [Verrucomicrobiae bacterium]